MQKDYSSLKLNLIPDKPKRRHCFFFRTKKSFSICIVVTIFLIVSTAFLIFFIWPRIPDVKLVKITYSNGNELNANKPGNIKVNNKEIQIPLLFNFQVQNKNYFDIIVNNITSLGYLDQENKEDTQIGLGSLDEHLILSERQSTDFKYPFNITFDLSNSKVYNKIISVCLPNIKNLTSIPSNLNNIGSGKSIKIYYNVKLYLALIQWSGYVPEINDSFDYPCDKQLQDALLGYAKQSISKPNGNNSVNGLINSIL